MRGCARSVDETGVRLSFSALKRKGWDFGGEEAAPWGEVEWVREW